MAAVPSLSEPQRSGDSHPAVSHLVQKLVEEVLAWQRRNGVQKIPSKYSGDCEERKLALRFEKLLLRRDKALGTEPSRSQLPLNTKSSGVPQPAASCHEPRSPMVFMKYLEPIWADEVAAGQKMFECVANKTKWQNQFKQLSAGDIFIVVMKGRDKVNAVCEVASPAIVKETNRDVLKSKVQESRHAALDAYLDGAESFDYVEFKLVFDCRRFLLNGSTAVFLNDVGLSVPKSPGFTARPVVHDEHWHNRLYKYMHNRSICHRQ